MASCNSCKDGSASGSGVSRTSGNANLSLRYQGYNCASGNPYGAQKNNVRSYGVEPSCHSNRRHDCNEGISCKENIYMGPTAPDLGTGLGATLNVQVDTRDGETSLRTNPGRSLVPDTRRTCANFYSISAADFATAPVVIDQSGIYTLEDNVPDLSYDAAYDGLITVATSGVEIRLNGKTIGADTTYAAANPDLAVIRVARGSNNVFINNGTLGFAPYGIAEDDSGCVSVSNVTINNFTRRGIFFSGITSGQVIDSVVSSSTSVPYGNQYEMALRLLMFISGLPYVPAPLRAIGDITRDQIIVNLQALISGGTLNNPDGIPEEGAVGIWHGPTTNLKMISSGKNLLVSHTNISIDANPIEVIGMAIAGTVLKDPLGYLISWTELVETPLPVSTNVTTPVIGGTGLAIPVYPDILNAQLYASTYTDGFSLPSEFVNWYNAGGSGTLNAVPVPGLDFRGNPLFGVAAVAQAERTQRHKTNASNNQYARVIVSKVLNESLQSPTPRLSYRKKRYSVADSYGFYLTRSSTTTIDSSTITTVQTDWGNAIGVYIDQWSSDNAITNPSISNILAGPPDTVIQSYDQVNTQPQAFGVYGPINGGTHMYTDINASGYSSMGFLPYVGAPSSGGSSTIVTGPPNAAAFSGSFPIPIAPSPGNPVNTAPGDPTAPVNNVVV